MALALVTGMLGVQLAVTAVLLDLLATRLGQIADLLERVFDREERSAL